MKYFYPYVIWIKLTIHTIFAPSYFFVFSVRLTPTNWKNIKSEKSDPKIDIVYQKALINKNISPKFFDHKITFVNSQH